MMDAIPEKLLRARRALDSLTQVKTIHGWNYDTSLDVWYYHINIRINDSNPLIPQDTQWYITVTPEYPKGKIKVFPDVKNSICVTMYHQSNNASIEKNGLWRKGALCLNYNLLSLYISEPETVDDRLLYYVKRAVLWLEAAASNELVSKDDLFELPDFDDSLVLSKKFVFSEDGVSFLQWEDADVNYGIAEINMLSHVSGTFFVKQYKSKDFVPIRIVEWGEYLSRESADSVDCAIWILLKRIPVLNVWQPPETLEELRYVCLNQDIDIDEALANTSKHLRDGRRHFLLVGFPIPEFFFGENNLVFWQALYLPTLSSGKHIANGFRKNELGYRMRDIQEVLRDSLKLEWIKSENWNQKEVSQRGRVDAKLIRKSILMIGAGCVGSAVAEILVRSGVYNLAIMDSDILEVGNLSRHSLTLDDVGLFKVRMLCERLNSINPHARIKCIEEELFEDEESKLNVDLEKYHVILDCSGNNDVLKTLSHVNFEKTHDIVSISVGLGADHLYISMKRGLQISFASFYAFISDFLSEDRMKYANMTFPRDGTGCWHPTFPARLDDIWIAAATAVKLMEGFVTDNQSTSVSMVFKKQESEGYFTGYNMIDKSDE